MLAIPSSFRLMALLVFSAWATMTAFDLYTPSLPLMAKYYGTSDDWMDVTITVNILSFPLIGIFWGPLSDAFGRRHIFIIGMVLFVIGSVICATIPSLSWMIFGRFIQGVGTCVADILTLAIVNDLYKGDAAAKKFSTLEMFMMIAPLLAPLLGGFIADSYGWEYNFYVILVLALVTLFLVYGYLPESLPKDKRSVFSFKASFAMYQQIFSHRKFLGYAFITSLLFSGLFVIIIGTPYLYQDVYGFSVLRFTMYMVIGVAAFALAAETNRRFVERVGRYRMIWLGMTGMGVSGILVLLNAFFAPMNPELVRLTTGLYIFFMGFAFSNGATIALSCFPDQSGTASAALIALEMLCAAIAITLTGYFYHDSFMPLAVLMMIFSTLAFLVCRALQDPEEHPPIAQT